MLVVGGWGSMSGWRQVSVSGSGIEDCKNRFALDNAPASACFEARMSVDLESNIGGLELKGMAEVVA